MTKVGIPTLAPADLVPVNDDTRPDEKVVSFVREANKRRLRQVNEHDLLRALQTIRPEDPDAA